MSPPRPARRAPSAWERQRRIATLAVLLLPVAAFAVLFVAPMAQLAVLSLDAGGGIGLANYAELARPLYLRLILFTLQLALGVTLLCILLGYPVAYLITSLGGALARWIAAVLFVSLWLSILTRTYGWIVLLQRNGLVNQLLQSGGLTDAPLPLVYNTFGVMVGMTHLLLPFMVVALIPSLRAVDPGLVRASLSLGAPPLRTFLRVYLPLTVPGLFAGSVLVFIMAIGYFVTPAVLGGGQATTIALAIRTQVQVLLDLPLAAATSMALLVISVGALLLYERLSGVDRMFGRRER